MNENLVNELIEQLKQNLNNVESARNQVEKTVQAYNTLGTDVNKYTSELNIIAQNVKTMISQLEEIKEMFARNVSTQIIDEIQVAITTIANSINGVSSHISDLTNAQTEQLTGSIKQGTDSVITTFASTRTELSNQISSLYDLTDAQTEQLIGNIKQRTDYIVKTIGTEINDVKINTASCINQIGQLAASLQSFRDCETTHYEALVKQLKEQELLLDRVRKQNTIFFISIIVLLFIIGGFVIFNHTYI